MKPKEISLKKQRVAPGLTCYKMPVGMFFIKKLEDGVKTRREDVFCLIEQTKHTRLRRIVALDCIAKKAGHKLHWFTRDIELLKDLAAFDIILGTKGARKLFYLDEFGMLWDTEYHAPLDDTRRRGKIVLNTWASGFTYDI